MQALKLKIFTATIDISETSFAISIFLSKLFSLFLLYFKIIYDLFRIINEFLNIENRSIIVSLWHVANLVSVRMMHSSKTNLKELLINPWYIFLFDWWILRFISFNFVPLLGLWSFTCRYIYMQFTVLYLWKSQHDIYSKVMQKR